VCNLLGFLALVGGFGLSFGVMHEGVGGRGARGREGIISCFEILAYHFQNCFFFFHFSLLVASIFVATK
jgi:hypothetical protein